MKSLVRIVEVVGIIAAVVFVAALFVNEPDDSPVAAGGPTPTTDPGSLYGEPAPPPTDAPAPGSPDLLSIGEDLYGRRCAGCHGGDGGGGLGPKLGDGAVVGAFPDPADQLAIIRDGKSGMPSFGNLSAEELDALVAYTRELLGR